MGSKIFLANVGANTSHRFSSPLFNDNTFEFIPIPETSKQTSQYSVLYKDLKSYNDPSKNLVEFIPRRLWNQPTHNDPEFETFTYGDNCQTTPRGAALKNISEGDYLFFLAHLTRWSRGQFTRDHGFYLIGFLEILQILKEVRSRPKQELLLPFGSNAHIRQGLSNPLFWNRFWVFRGSQHSQRFLRAVPFTRELISQILTTADGSPWCWSAERTDLQIIGSYTRSCRCVIDSNYPAGLNKARLLWNWISHWG